MGLRVLAGKLGTIFVLHVCKDIASFLVSVVSTVSDQFFFFVLIAYLAEVLCCSKIPVLQCDRDLT